MRIGLLSDTHGFLDEQVFSYFESCDEIWHAGDFGSMSLVQQLEEFKPLRGVYGNIDEPAITRKFPEDLEFECEGLRIIMSHIGGAPPHYNPRIRTLLGERSPDIFVCGHSHILKVVKDDKNDLLYLNPGAAGNQGFHHIKTLIRFEISAKAISNLEVIELGRRGQLS